MKTRWHGLSTYVATLGVILGLGLYVSAQESSPSRKIATAADPEPGAPDLSVLDDFNYRLTDIPPTEVESMYRSLRTDLGRNAEFNCGERAHVWAYQMLKERGIQSGKLFLFYTRKNWAHGGHKWWFHVAPYVVSGGKEYVMEKAFGINRPLELKEWLAQRSGFDTCTEIDPIQHRSYVQHYLNKKYILPHDDGNCYVRKSSPGYLYPRMVADFDLNGVNKELTPASAYTACMAVMNGKKTKDRQRSCSRFLTEPSFGMDVGF